MAIYLNKKTRLTILFLAFLSSLFVLVYFLFFDNVLKQEQEIASPENQMVLGIDCYQEYEKWDSILKQKNPDKAYLLFKRDNSVIDNFGTRHFMAHIFGELLYDNYGTNGIAICDSEFAFGCYHSFFARALSENGSQIISELDNVCIEKFGEEFAGLCQHGIGHGVLEYVGHDRLVEAVKLCDNSKRIDSGFGCLSGIYMEYNFPTTFSLENSTSEVRQFDSEYPYSPCDSIVPEFPVHYRLACYNNLGPWFLSVLEFNIGKVGKLCDNINNTEEKKYCFMGTGQYIGIIVNNEHVFASAEGKCGLMPSVQGYEWCMEGSARGFAVLPEEVIN